MPRLGTPGPRSQAFLGDYQKLPETLGDLDELEDLLGQFLDRCRTAHGDLHLSDDIYLAHLGTHQRGSDWQVLLEVHVEDLFLACACVQGLELAQRRFAAHYVPLIPKYLARMSLTQDQLAEVTQDLLIHLLLAEDSPPRIAAYSGKGTLSGWVRIATVRRALSFLRAEEPEWSLGSGILLARLGVVSADQEGRHIKERHRDDVRQAFREALQVLPTELRQLLRLHYLEKRTFTEIAELHKCGRATVVRGVARARAQLLEQIRAKLAERLGIGEEDSASLLRQLRSQLGPSLLDAL